MNSLIFFTLMTDNSVWSKIIVINFFEFWKVTTYTVCRYKKWQRNESNYFVRRGMAQVITFSLALQNLSWGKNLIKYAKDILEDKKLSIRLLLVVLMLRGISVVLFLSWDIRLKMSCWMIVRSADTIIVNINDCRYFDFLI